MASFSSTTDGILKSPMSVSAESLKLVKISQYMNSAGLTLSMKKWCTQNGLIFSIVTDGLYNFLLKTNNGHLMPIEFLPDEYIRNHRDSQYYCSGDMLIFCDQLNRIVLSTEAKKLASQLSKSEIEILEVSLKEYEDAMALCIHREEVYVPELIEDASAPVGWPSDEEEYERLRMATRKVDVQLTFWFCLLEATKPFSQYISRSLNAEFETVAAASPRYKTVALKRIERQMSGSVNLIKRVAILKWRRAINRLRVITPKKVTIVAPTPSTNGPPKYKEAPDFKGILTDLLKKAKKLWSPARRRSSMFGGSNIGSSKSGSVAPKDQLQNTAANLRELTAGALQLQAAETFAHRGDKVEGPNQYTGLLCDELIQLIQSFDVVNAGWIKLWSTTLRNTGVASLEQISGNWQTKDLIFPEVLGFTAAFGIKEPARVIFEMIVAKLDIVDSQTQVTTIVNQLCQIRLSPHIEEEEFSVVSKQMHELLNFIEIDLASALPMSDVMKIAMSLWTKIDPTNPNTAQLKRDQREVFIDVVRKSGNLRDGLDHFTACHDKIVVHKAQNKVFDALSTPASQRRSTTRFQRDDTFTMFLGESSTHQGGGGGRGGGTSHSDKDGGAKKNMNYCLTNLRFVNQIQGAKACGKGSECKFSHNKLPQGEHSRYTCKTCGNFLCKGALPSKWPRCENVKAKVVPQKQLTVAYVGTAAQTELSDQEIAMLTQAYDRGTQGTQSFQQGQQGKGGKENYWRGKGKGATSTAMNQAVLTLSSTPQHVLATEELAAATGSSTMLSRQMTPREQMLNILSARAAQAGAIQAHRSAGRSVN